MKKTSEEAWLDGSDCWVNMNQETRWYKHEDSEVHKNAVNFLYNKSNSNIATDLQSTGKAHLTQCQEKNRYFFANALIPATKFLAKKSMAFYGSVCGEGNVGDLINLLSDYNPLIKKQMEIKRKDLHLVKPVHHDNIKFCINQMALQLKDHIMTKLQSAQHYCIIADEWTCKHSNKAYCSVSLRCVYNSLEVNTFLMGYIRLANAKAVDVVAAIIKALTRHVPVIIFKKITAQTYDGASVMQGHLSGVQKRIKSDYCPFALNLHCVNHQLQIDVKGMNKGHNLISRITDNCFIIVKLIKYSPKRAAALEKAKDDIKRGINAPPSYYTSLTKKVLDFCVTRWTVRYNSLHSIDVNHLSLLSLFCSILLDKDERRGLKVEKVREITGLIRYMQSFEFLFGIKLSKMLYFEVDKIATHLQGDKICISNAIEFVKQLIDRLEEMKKDGFETLWGEVMKKRMDLNTEAQNIQSLVQSSFFTEVEKASCPRGSIVALRQVNKSEDEAKKAY